MEEKGCQIHFNKLALQLAPLVVKHQKGRDKAELNRFFNQCLHALESASISFDYSFKGRKKDKIVVDLDALFGPRISKSLPTAPTKRMKKRLLKQTKELRVQLEKYFPLNIDEVDPFSSNAKEWWLKNAHVGLHNLEDFLTDPRLPRGPKRKEDTLELIEVCMLVFERITGRKMESFGLSMQHKNRAIMGEFYNLLEIAYPFSGKESVKKQAYRHLKGGRKLSNDLYDKVKDTIQDYFDE